MTAYPKAADEISRFVRTLIPNATVRQFDSVHFQIASATVKTMVTFGAAQLDDFDKALTSTSFSHSYVAYITNGIHLQIMSWLARSGMLPQIKMSDVLLQCATGYEARSIKLMIDFRPDTAEKLYQQLKILERSLAATVQAANSEGIAATAVKKELEHLRAITTHYETFKNLNSLAEWTSLSLLKGAALMWIIDLESKKSKTTSPRVKAEFDEKIHVVFQEFHCSPWDRIPFPPALQEYLSRPEPSRPEPTTRQLTRENLFNIDALLANLDPRLVKRRAGAWAALKSANEDSVSQAVNSMVEVLDQTINAFCDGKEFKKALEEKYPQLERVNSTTRAWISAVKESLHAIKHHTTEQPVYAAEDVMHAAELIIRSLLR